MDKHSGFSVEITHPQKHLQKGFSGLYARVIALFDTLPHKYYRICMDNLYNSAKFSKEAWLHPHCVLVHGVARKGCHGVPNCVIQEIPRSKLDQDKVRGTHKVARLVNDSN